MKKPEKPYFEKFTGFLTRWFGSKPRTPSNLRENKRWKPTPIKTAPAPDNADPAVKFRNLAATRAGDNTALLDVAPTQTQTRETRAPIQFFLPPEEKNRKIDLPAARPAPAAPAKIKETPEKSADGGWRFFDLSKVMPTFWTVASLLSVVVNVILILTLVILGRELFVLKSLVGDKLLGGLYENFIYMDQAHIQTNISVSENIPISFTLPISQDTTVTLTQSTPINGANVRISTGGLTINSPANIVLPAGTTLPVRLEMNVPVTTTVPIRIQVPVDIPLAQTDLHKPFIGLQQVVAPFYNMMQPQIKSPQDIWLCGPFAGFCSIYFQK